MVGRIPVLGALLATALTGLMFGPTFGSAGPLVVPLLGVAAAGYAVDEAVRAWPRFRSARPGLRPVRWALMLALGLVAIVETTLRSSTLGGLPTTTTLRALYDGPRRSWLLTLQTTSPARPLPQLVVFVPMLVLLATVAAVWLLYAGRRLTAMLPGLVVAGVAHAFRPVSTAGAAVLVIGFAAAAAAVLADRGARDDARPGSMRLRMRDRVTGLAGLAGAAGLPGVGLAVVLGAFLGAAADPGHQSGYSLRDHVPSVAAPASAVSPLDDIAYRLQHPQDPVFSVRDSPGTDTWRLAVYDGFDGRTWTSSDHLRYLGARIDPLRGRPVPTSQHNARVLVDALPGPWLPSQDGLTSVSGIAPVVDEGTGVLLSSGVKPFLGYRVSWTSPDLAATDLTGAALAPQAAPDASTLGSIPPSIVAVVRAAVGSSGSSGSSAPTFRTALLLERYLREHYQPSTGADVPSGHDWTRLVQFLGEPASGGSRDLVTTAGGAESVSTVGSSGTSEQFAAAYVVLARIAGIPARLAVGFRQPGQANPDGSYVIRNGDVLAWPEVAVRGIGWVPMDPMGEPGGGGQNATTLALDRARAKLPPPPSPPRDPTPRPPGAASRSNGGSWLSTVAGGGLRAALVVLAAWLLGVPLAKRVRTEVRRRRVGNAAVLSAWLETRDRLREQGVAVDARMTVREVARAGTRLVDVRGGWALEELGGLVDEALWSGAAAGRPGADAAWRAAEDVRLGLRRRSLFEQVAISVDVRSLRRVR
jgi:hypothetical protein